MQRNKLLMNFIKNSQKELQKVCFCK